MFERRDIVVVREGVNYPLISGCEAYDFAVVEAVEVKRGKR